MSKVWFIRGAGSGIGAATAKAALRADDRVVATGRNLEKLRNALNDVAGENLAFAQLDVADGRQAKAAVVEAVGREFGATDIVTERGDEGVARIQASRLLLRDQHPARDAGSSPRIQKGTAR